MSKKVHWKKALFYLLIAIIIITSIIIATDFLRWQMARGIFWRPSEIDPLQATVVIICPMHTPPAENLIMNPAYVLADYIQQLADVNIDIIHYPEADFQRVKKHDPICVFISGQTAPWTDYEQEKLQPIFQFLHRTSLPVLGVCGGHQIIAQAYGVLVAPMGYDELGYIQVELLADDPIFHGLENPITVFSWHSEEAKEMPDNFRLLGSSNLCEIQIFTHDEKKIYGVQFHPEFAGRKPDGKILLTNFLEMAGLELRK